MRKITSESDLKEKSFIPEDVVGPFLPVTQQEIDIFNDSLSDEIDSAYTSSICCCDNCYDEFCTLWPDVAFRIMDFQNQSSGVFWLVENTRLPGFFSPAEISTLRHFVLCTRCLNYVPHNIWIYEHRFSNASEIEGYIDEILTLGNQTPFLLLEHHFAQRILYEIRERIKGQDKISISISLFRARTEADILRCDQSPSNLETFGPPPSAYVGEGRFNHAGSPMLYLASTPQVAAAEIGQPGEPCLIGEIKVKAPLIILDLVDIDEDENNSDIMRALSSSALLAAPRTGEGWLKRQYIFSRFVADCAKSAGYDAIRYGSTKTIDGDNYVLLNPLYAISEIVELVGYHSLAGFKADHRY